MINCHMSFANSVFKQMFKQITAAVLLLLACAAHAEDNVLLWWFNDPDITEVDGSTIKTGDLVGRGAVEGKTANLIRIKATDGKGDTVYLNLGSDPYLDKDGTPCGGWLDGWAIPDLNDQWKAGPAYADLSGLNLSDTALTFAMEIGYAEFDADDNIVNWMVLAGGSDTLQTLVDGGHIISTELSYQGSINWAGGGISVPEPSSGLLMLMGGALLALRRRRKNVCV